MTEVSERSIFLQALELKSDDARSEYLADVCAGNVHLRDAVEKLLSAHDRPDNLLDQPLASAPPNGGLNSDSTLLKQIPITEAPGEVIGPYRLMEQIGEGGFGLVFVAEQLKPVRRKVALKVIKPGMDTREIIARFEAERQALALMDHPNIAQVFDAGTTETGRPYFVMELVRGVPINEFCDQHELDLRSRLELFLHVCSAVQHAHQKGVIHRDIKPSNVLVTLHDETAVPKVIDFGVAKALGHSLTDKTIYTRFAAMIGTPLYMSPEQAEMSGLDVDTRSDIYSLGVLLYELLTGSTPIQRERFNSVGLDEVRRIIREEDPPKPSTRLTTIAAAHSTVLSDRQRSPLPLSTAVRGDLDWIVMKTLEKDRVRRYESASELAEDVRRFLTEQPIRARPPSQLYQLQKFARRNRVAIVTVSLIASIMIIATSVSLWMAAVAVSEGREKDNALKEAVRLQREANTAREEIAEFAVRMKEANVLVTSGRAHADAERWAAAYADFTAAIQRQPNYYNAWTERASLEVQLGLWERAAEDYSKAIELGVPVDNPANWGIPQLFLLNGDITSHHKYCVEMLQQAQEQNDSPSISLIRSSVMAQDPPVADPNTLADAAIERLIENEFSLPERLPPPPGPGPPRHSGATGRPGDAAPGGRPPGFPPPSEPRHLAKAFRHPRGASLYTAGVALYRAERYDEAIPKLKEAMKDSHWRARAIATPVLAMAYHRSGDSKAARQAFVDAQTAIEEWTVAIEQGPVGSMPIPWFDWVECLLLNREASILLTGFAPADDPRLRQVQKRAEQVLDSATGLAR